MPEFTWLWAAIAAYVIAGSAAVGGVALRRLPERTVLAFLAAAIGLHTVSLALRWERLGHGPFVTLYEVLSSNVWSLALVFAIAYWRVRAVRPTAAFVLPVLFMMLGWLVTCSPEAGHLPPTYHTPWLWIHVGFGKVFLGAVLVAVGISTVILARAQRPAARRFPALPEDAKLERLAFRFMVLGFLFETLMLVSGALWAHDAWGRYWGWDPLETWAFATWLLLAAFLHARATLRLAPAAGAALVLAVFCLAFLTFFGVPFVSESPHTGVI